MTKLTKEQRRAKKKKKEARKESHKHDVHPAKKSLAPWEAPKMGMFTMPKLFAGDMTWEERVAILRDVGKKARESFDEAFPQVQRWLVEYDPIYILSMCAFYLIATPEGIDPEAEGRLDFPHHYLELLQAFALYQARTLDVKVVDDGLEKLKEEMKEVGDAISMRHLSLPEGEVTQEEVDAHQLRAQMMGHTAAIRNWAYQHQMRKVVGDLARGIEADFFAKYGMEAGALIDVLFHLLGERTELINSHISAMRSVFREKKHREIISTYNRAFPENIPVSEVQADELWDNFGRSRRNLLMWLVSHANLGLASIYTFSIDHALALAGENITREQLEKMLDLLSYRFGDLDGFKKDHLILGNPVLARPFIKLDDSNYFSALWGILPHLAMDILEDLVWDDLVLREKYTKVKSKYLEDELERMVKASFPNAEIYRGSQWNDPVTNVRYENDLLVVIDGFALVLEAKSATVSDPARRGAPDRLATTFRELIESPSEQAHRFIAFLGSHLGQHEFSTKHGEKNIVNSAEIKYYIPLGVTLSHLGSIGSNLKKLVRAKITSKSLEDLAPSISFMDFECVLELLPMEVEKIHYFARRREFEAHMDYEGDEMDLLGFYLDNGFNIGETEYDGSTFLQMLLKSKELDPYFIGSREGVKVRKPSLSMTLWWRDILEKISEVRTLGWMETGFILLNTTKEDQELFEAQFKLLGKRVMNGKASHDHNFVVWKTGPERRRYVIVGYPYAIDDGEVRDEIVPDVLNQHFDDSVRGVVLIGLNMAAQNYPYSFIARMAATSLFDQLTL